MVVLKLLSSLFDQRHKFKIGDEIENYCIVDYLGEGRFGIVYLAINSFGEKVIIKQLKREMLLRQPQKIHFEYTLLQNLSILCDERFPKYISSIKLKYRRGYILEYKEGKTLETLIYKESHVFTRLEIYAIAYQILDMLEVLHTHHIVHKDIRVSNIIMNNEGKLSLIDFGLARYIDFKHYTPDIDYWYLGDLIIHLFYTSYTKKILIDKPWYEQLDLLDTELLLLKKLMQVDKINYPSFTHLSTIRNMLDTITSSLSFYN